MEVLSEDSFGKISSIDSDGRIEFMPLVSGTHYIQIIPDPRLDGSKRHLNIEFDYDESKSCSLTLVKADNIIAFEATKGEKKTISIEASGCTYKDFKAKIYAISPGYTSKADGLNRMGIITEYTTKTPIRKVEFPNYTTYPKDGITMYKFAGKTLDESVPDAYSSYQTLHYATSLDGRYIYYAHDKSSDIICYDRETGAKTVVFTCAIVDMKTNADGSLLAMLVYEPEGNKDFKVYLYNRELNKISQITVSSLSSNALTKMFLTKDALYFIDSSIIYRNEADKPREEIATCASGEYLTKLTESSDNKYIAYTLSTGVTKLITKTVSYASETIDISAGIFGEIPNIMYVNGKAYDVKTKTSRNLTTGTLLGVLKDDRLLMKETNTKFFIYDPITDEKITFDIPDIAVGNTFNMTYDEENEAITYVDTNGLFKEKKLDTGKTVDKYLIALEGDNRWYSFSNGKWNVVSKSEKPGIEEIKTYGMSAEEVNNITVEAFHKLQENRDLTDFKIAVFLNSNSSKVVPKINRITIDYTEKEKEILSKTTWQFKKEPIEISKMRKINSIKPIETFTEGCQILYFFQVGENIYGFRENKKILIRQEEEFNLITAPTTLAEEVQKYGMSAEELSKMSMPEFETAFPAAQTPSFNIFAVIISKNGAPENVSITYNIDMLITRFAESVTLLEITLTDDTVISFDEGEITHEEIEEFMDWLEDRKHNRGPVFYKFNINGIYQLINYYMIKAIKIA